MVFRLGVVPSSKGSLRLGSIPRWSLGASLALGLVVADCGGTDVLGTQIPYSCDLADYELSAAPESWELSVATCWVDGAEQRAFDVLKRAAEGGPYLVRPVDRRDRDQQQTSLETWLINDSDPLPDAFQVNGGSDVLQWLEDENAEPQLCELERLDARYAFRQRYFSAALSPLICHGKLYGLPLGIHRVNTLFFNREVIERAQMALGDARDADELLGSWTTTEDFVAYLAALDALRLDTTGERPLLPLALDNQTTWPMAILAFDNLLAGTEAYEDVWLGTSADPAGLRSSLEVWLDRLRRLVARGRTEVPLTWRGALEQVLSGEAAFTVMGDWGWAELRLGDRALANVGSVAFPGSEPRFVYTPDSFSVPAKAGSSGHRAHFWLREIIDQKATQIGFAASKQALPARRDLNAEELELLGDERLKQQYLRFAACEAGAADCRLVLAVSGLAPSPGRDPCFDELPELLWLSVGGLDPSDGALPELPGGYAGGGGGGAGGESGGVGRKCERPRPLDANAAGAELIARLLDVAAHPFTPGCR